VEAALAPVGKDGDKDYVGPACRLRRVGGVSLYAIIDDVGEADLVHSW